MKLQETRQEIESWQECDNPQSQNPRLAVSEWCGRNPNVEKTERINPKPVAGLVGHQWHADFAQGSLKLATKLFGVCDITALWSETRNRMDLCELKLTNPLTDYSASTIPNIVLEFNDRAERWRRETSFQSSLVAQFMHEDYQFIMAKGTEVIPLILGRLKKVPENWFWALKHLAGEDVAKDTDNPSDAAKAWIKWGKKQGYID